MKKRVLTEVANSRQVDIMLNQGPACPPEHRGSFRIDASRTPGPGTLQPICLAASRFALATHRTAICSRDGGGSPNHFGIRGECAK